MALLAPSEELLAENVYKVAAADGCPFGLIDKIALSKCWLTSRDIMNKAKLKADREQCARSEPQKEGDDILEADAKEVVAKWVRVHSHTLPDVYLLIPSIQGELWRGLFPPAAGAIPSLKVLLMEELRTMDRLSKKKDLVMTVAAARSMEAEEVVRDSISVPIEIYKRARAYFWTVAFICVRNKRSWFELQTAMLISEQVLAFTTQTFHGQTMPLNAMITAWAATSHHFSEQVRMSGRTLKEICLASGEWHHRWTTWTPDSTDSVFSARIGLEDSHRGGAADLPIDLRAEIAIMNKNMRRLQADRDQMSNDLRNIKQRTNGGGKGSYDHSSGGGNPQTPPGPLSRRQQKLANMAVSYKSGGTKRKGQ